MDYGRVIGRNMLHGDYTTNKNSIAGDLRRFENDVVGAWLGPILAEKAGVDLETWRRCMEVLLSHDSNTAGFTKVTEPCYNPEHFKLEET